MENDIKQKLEIELNKDIIEETQVIYILSRIRKILEIGKKKKQYPILKFYCDWALHAEIENIDAVRPSVEGVVAGNDEALINFILFHADFYAELKKFLKEYNLPIKIFEKQAKAKFSSLLSQVYSDTPLVIKTIKRKKVIWQANKNEGTSLAFGGSFKIEDEK